MRRIGIAKKVKIFLSFVLSLMLFSFGFACTDSGKQNSSGLESENSQLSSNSTGIIESDTSEVSSFDSSEENTSDSGGGDGDKTESDSSESSSSDSTEGDTSDSGDGDKTPITYKIWYDFVLEGVQIPENCQYDETEKLYYQEVEKEEMYVLPNFDKFNNYKFSHWVITGTQTKFESGDSYALEGNVYLTAIWIDRTTDDNWA